MSHTTTPTVTDLFMTKKLDWSIISLVGFAHATSHFSHLLIPSLFPLYAQDLGLNYSHLAFLMGVYFVFSGVFQFISGFLVDRFGTERVLFLALSLLALGALTLAVASNLPLLTLAAIFLGVGNSSFHPVDYSILNQRISNPRIGLAYSSHSVMGTLGWAVTPVFLSWMSNWYNWRLAYLSAAGIFVLVLALCYYFKNYLKIDKTQEPTQQKSSNTLSLKFLTIPAVWRSFSFFVFSMAALSIVQNFAIPIFHKDLFQLSYAEAAGIVSSYMFCSAFGIVVGGLVLNQMLAYHVKILASSISLVALIYFILALFNWSVEVFTMILLLAAFVAGIGSPFRDLYIKKATPTHTAGKVYGFIYSGLDVGAAIFPWIFAFFLNQGQVRSTLVVVAVALILAVVSVIPLQSWQNWWLFKSLFGQKTVLRS